MSVPTIRVPDRSEAPQIAALLNANAVALHGEADISAAVVREWFDNPDVTIRLVERDGRSACYGDLALSVDATRADLDIREHPDYPGASEAMLEEFERLASERGAAAVRAFPANEEAVFATVLQRRGYRPIRHSFRMLIRFSGELEAPRWPAGLSVRTMREGEEPAVHAAQEDAFRDHWGFEHQPYERWARWNVETERFDRALNFVADDGDTIAGLCLCSLHWSGYPTHGWVGILGVRPPWRRRGLGLALLLHGFAELRRRGCDRVGLGVDGENATCAVRLYERAGMSVERRNDLFEKTL